VLIKTHAASDIFRQHRFETDGGQLIFVLNRTGLFEFGQTILNRLRVIRHPLEAAFMEQALGAARKIEQPPLERRATDIGDQDFHIYDLQFTIYKSPRLKRVNRKSSFVNY
jgi:hypothetical protein